MSREEAFRKWYHKNVCSWGAGCPLDKCDCASAPLYSGVWFQEQEPRIWQAALAHAVEVMEGMAAVCDKRVKTYTLRDPYIVANNKRDAATFREAAAKLKGEG